MNSQQRRRHRFGWLYYLLTVLSLSLGMLCPAQAQQETSPGQISDEANKKPRPMLDTFMRNAYEGRLLARALNLNEEQQIRIAEIRRQFGPTWQQVWRTMRMKRMALEDVIFSEDFNETVALQRAKELADAQAQFLVLQTRIQIQVRKVLTLEQMQTFNELRQETNRRLLNRFPGQGIPHRNQ